MRQKDRILIAAECVCDGRWFVRQTTRLSRERVAFDRPIGQNQGVRFLIALVHVE